MNCVCQQATHDDFYVFRRIIVDKIDEDKNDLVDLTELKNWISFTQRRYIDEDVNRQWKQHNLENSEQLSWEVSVESIS